MNSDEKPPEGWKVIRDMPPTPALCHSDKPWWEGPSGEWFCGTCHPTPWLGLGRLHPNDQACQHQWSTRANNEPGRCMKCGAEP